MCSGTPLGVGGIKYATRRPASMTRILLGVSPIGLGHAARALVLAPELRRRGAVVKVFSGGKAAEFMRGQGEDAESIVDDPVPTVIGGEMRRVSLWYARSWLALRRTTRRTERLFDSFAPDLVVCDEEFSGMTVAEARGVKSVFITDELELGFARGWLSRRIESRVDRWYRGLQRGADMVVVPDAGEDRGNMRHVGPIVRKRTAGCGEVRALHSLPAGRMVLCSMSGSGIGKEVVDSLLAAYRSARWEGTFVAVTGNRGATVAGEGVYDLGVVGDNQDLVACADVVVSTAGKSTIDEAAAAGTPAVVIPIRYHAEQERNAKELGYSFEDLGRLAEIVGEKLGKRLPPREFDGEARAADAILSLGRGSGPDAR